MRLLIIGDLAGHVGAASRIAMRRGAEVVQADGIAGGLAVVRSGRAVDLILSDVRLDTSHLIAGLAREARPVPVVACGQAADAAGAVAAIAAGARDYLPLPPDPDLVDAILAAVAGERVAIVHADPAMAAVVAMADRVARSEASVLIVGESGTGKEVIARHLHAKSRRAGQRLVAVNCAAIPETLMESELFGHEKGAFTGALARRIGRFEEASGGTLLLDEISELDLRLQPKLLRAIQEREIDRVGGTAPVKVDVRIIATSNRRLEEEVAAGRFRGDLYFRLNVVTLRLPPLRQRQRDIPALARHFVLKYAELNGVAPPRLTREAERALTGYGWPGNVRELENVMHRAVVLAEGGEIGAVGLLPDGAASPRCDPPPPAAHPAFAAARPEEARAAPLVGRTVAAVEQDLIIDTLSHCLGNRTHAATILGISIRTLRNKLRDYAEAGVTVPPPAALAASAPVGLKGA